MRGLTDTSIKFAPTLWGSMSTDTKTAVGIPVDTRGFNGCLATLVTGAAAGSNGACEMALDCKIQECATQTGTGALWADVTDFDLTQIAITSTGPLLYFEKKYMQFAPDHKRYIRAHLTGSSGAAGLGPRFSVNLILTDPVDTLYVVDTATVAQTYAEHYYTVG